ncbi:protein DETOXIFICATION 16 isoform X2 [Amborella trichopoda]|uniref:protein DETOXIFICATION 16 isoform X2 n=1 Tax=Amborella trichopoda TaxID=13333 RepID=UPI0009BF398F|nr:protein DETOXIFICATION 16 isoform X2 [Amborella trichopoda]|eukprot:XP_020522926.1 protein DETOXIFICATION 16 isoform X2 [Amborella trichopoda]
MEEENGLKLALISVQENGDPRNRDCGSGERKKIDEIKTQIALAGPLIAVNLFQQSLCVISLMFVGHLGELSLSGASLATSFANATGFSLLSGMGSTLETLCGQAYGAKQYHMLGIYMQRALLVLSLFCVPLTFIWASTTTVLKAMGQDIEISEEAGSFIKWMIPSLFANAVLLIHSRFLQTQNIVLPMMITAGFTALSHIITCWALVFKCGLGSKGAAMAISISYYVNAILLVLYVKFSPACKMTWSGFSKESFHDLSGFLRLGIPSAAMICLQWWSFELLVFMSGLLPNPKLETSILSISTRVSNELGAGRPQVARFAVGVAVQMALAMSILVAVTLILLRHVLGQAYSKEEEVVDYMSQMIPLLATSVSFDGVNCVLSGTARGCGWQELGAFVNLGAYYIVGIPAAIALAFVLHMGGKGLWMGITCGLLVQMVVFVSITLCTDWEQQAQKARERIYNLTLPLDMVLSEDHTM